MAGWTNLTPSGGALAAGNAYLYEDTGALKYQGTSGSVATIVNADGTMATSAGVAYANGMLSANYYATASNNSSVSAAVNQTYFTLLFVPASTTFDRIATRTGATHAGTSVARLGIYNNDANGQPSTVVFDAGTVSCTAANSVYEITISQTLAAGSYWLATNVQTVGTTPNFRTSTTPYFQTTQGTTAGGGAQLIGWQQTGVTGAFATATGLTGGTNVVTTYLRKA